MTASGKLDSQRLNNKPKSFFPQTQSMSGRRRAVVFEVYNDNENGMPNVTRRQRQQPRPVTPLRSAPMSMPFVTRRSNDRLARMEREQRAMALELKRLRIGFKRLLKAVQTFSPKR